MQLIIIITMALSNIITVNFRNQFMNINTVPPDHDHHPDDDHDPCDHDDHPDDDDHPTQQAQSRIRPNPRKQLLEVIVDGSSGLTSFSLLGLPKE